LKAIVLEQPGQLELRDAAAPEAAAPGEARLRVKRVGICGTDLHAYGGNQNFFSYPRIMGHELAVEVIDIGATDSQLDYAVGDLCCVIPYLNCGACIACRRGKSNCCAQMQVLGVHIDGGMRERFNVPVDKLLKAEGVAVEELRVAGVQVMREQEDVLMHEREAEVGGIEGASSRRDAGHRGASGYDAPM